MIEEIQAKSLLRKHKRIDSWFLSSYAINLYRGCMHNCIYCDGRDDKYRVEGQFGRDISIKINASELLNNELNPAKKRKPFNNGFMIVCGGVSDSYQPLEKKYLLARQTLELLHRYGHPVHMLTKSSLIERDLDLLQEINRQSKAVVSFSFSSVDDKISRMLEPGASSPQKRLDAIKKFKDAGVSCGMFLMPVVPFITDSYEMIEQSVVDAKSAGADFVIFSGMTLKQGVQKSYFLNFLKKNFPELIPKYQLIYNSNNTWGAPSGEYVKIVEERFRDIICKYKMPARMPLDIYGAMFTKTELVVLMLEQLDYLAKLHNRNNPYGYAGYQISTLEKPIEKYSYNDLIRMKGIGQFTANIISEVVNIGKCTYYEKILYSTIQ